MKIYIVNCGLTYIFNGVDECDLLSCNARMSLIERIRNKITAVENVPEDMVQYKKLSDADHIIFFADTKRFVLRCNHIEDSVKNDTKLHLYLWNPMSYYADEIKNVSNKWHIWTFSKEEARTYKMLYAETFYNKLLVEESPVETDLFFVGKDKGRKAILESLKKDAVDDGLVTDINIVDGVKCMYNHKYSHKLPYDEVRKRIARTRALVDIVQEGQTGMTQRVLESLFFQKKLITNNLSIAEMPFYNASNIFLLGKDNKRELKRFVEGAYQDIEFDIDEFDVKKWLSGIINCKEFYAR